MAERRVYKLKKEERDVIRDRMLSYWEDRYQKDTESKIAQALLQNLDDPDSLFNDIEFLDKIVDDIENDKRPRKTRVNAEK